MTSFRECIVVPKEEFIQLTECKNHGINTTTDLAKATAAAEAQQEEEEEEESSTNHHQVGGVKQAKKRKLEKTTEDQPSSKKSKSMYKDKSFIKLIQDRSAFHSSLDVPRNLLNTGKKSSSAKNDIESENIILKMFPQTETFKLERIFFYIRQQPGLIGWNPQTLELIAFKKICPGSNIVEILSYLIGMNTRSYVSENKHLREIQGISIPKDTETFLQAFQHLLGLSRKNLAESNILDRQRVQEVETFFDVPFQETLKHLAEEHKKWMP